MRSEAFRYFDFYELQHEIDVWMKANSELVDDIVNIQYDTNSISENVTEYTALIFYRFYD